MSIATRIEAIEEHLTDDYSVLTLAGADLTNVDKNIINLKQTWEERLLYFINNGTEVVWNNWNKVNGTGTSLTLNNTEEAPMTIEYKGNTSQASSGEQTISITDIQEGAINGSTGEAFDNPIRRRIDYVETIVGTQTLSFSGTDLVCYVYFYNSSKGYLGYNTGGWQTSPFTFTPPINTKYIRAVFKKNPDNYPTDLSNVQLKIDNAPLSPSFPQDIHIVSGDNTIIVSNSDNTQSATYPINLGDKELCKIGTYKDRIFKSSGKNKYNGLYTTKKFVRKSDGTIQNSDDWSATDFIPVAPNTTYRLSGITNGWSGSAGTSFYDETKTFISSINSTEQTFTTPNNAKYIRISLNTETPTNIMLNEGTTALPYEPYGKDWYLNKQIGKVVLNGSENWNGGTLVEDYMYVYCNDYDNIFSPNMAYTGISTHFKVLNQIINTYSPVITTDSISLGSDTPTAGNRVRVKINKATTNTIANFKTWLSTNNVEVYYVLNTPTYEKITGELLNQLEAIKKSYENQTNINQENNDLPFELVVGALEKY